MNDLIDDVRIDGNIEFEGSDIYDSRVDVASHAASAWYSTAKPLSKSIYENVAYGLRIQGETSNAVIDERVGRLKVPPYGKRSKTD